MTSPTGRTIRPHSSFSRRMLITSGNSSSMLTAAPWVIAVETVMNTPACYSGKRWSISRTTGFIFQWVKTTHSHMERNE